MEILECIFVSILFISVTCVINEDDVVGVGVNVGVEMNGIVMGGVVMGVP